MSQNLSVKEHILHAAKHYFYNEGYENTTTRKIAKSLGILHSNIFYYFKNKEEILTYIFKDYYKKYFELIFEMKSDPTDVEFLLSTIYISNYFISFNKKFKTLYFEATDIIIDILSEYAKHLYPKIHPDIRLSDSSKNQNKYLIDVAVMVAAEKEILKLSNKKYIHLRNKDMRDYVVDLFAKLQNLDEETYISSKKTAELIARKIDYNRLNIFDDCYKINLNGTEGIASEFIYGQNWQSTSIKNN